MLITLCYGSKITLWKSSWIAIGYFIQPPELLNTKYVISDHQLEIDFTPNDIILSNPPWSYRSTMLRSDKNIYMADAAYFVSPTGSPAGQAASM